MNDTDKPELYMLDEKGRLFRGGEEIGLLNGDKIELKEEAKTYKASVTRWLNQKATDQEKADKDKKERGDKPKPEASKLTPEEEQKREEARLNKEALEQGKKARALHADDLEFARANKIPEPPKKHPEQGDKTPAYVEWLYKHRRANFDERYGFKKDGQVPIIKKDSEGIEQIVGWKDAHMATRKTHLTEKIEGDRDLGSDTSWDA